MSAETLSNAPLATREDWATEKFNQNMQIGAEHDGKKTVLPPVMLVNSTGDGQPIVDIAGQVQQHLLPEQSQYDPIIEQEVLTAQESITDQTDHIIDKLKVGVQQGVQEGYLPSNVLPNLDLELATTAVMVLDSRILDRLNVEEESEIHGDYNEKTDIVRLAHDLSPSELEGTLIHEYLHKLSGGTFRFDEDKGFVRTRTGFSEKKDSGTSSGSEVTEQRHECLNEAVNSHLERAVADGDFATIDPDMRNEGPEDDFNYVYRSVLADFIEKSGGVIDLKTITRAAFEENGEQPVTTERRAMVRQARAAYGTGAFRKFEKICRAIEYLDPVEEAFQSKLLGMYERIKGPEIGPNGEIVRPGSIDTEGLDELLKVA